MISQRTYWHLNNGKIPSHYDITTSKLLYHPDKGFEIDVPVKDWFTRYQRNSEFQGVPWEQFSDPAKLTYTLYVNTQKEREAFVDKILNLIEQSDYNQKLDSDWLVKLNHFLPHLRFIYHGLQMASAYVGQIAPSSRIVIACTFQTADEIRKIQRCAYRMYQLQKVIKDFGSDSKVQWEQMPQWQPLRRLIEQLLVTYDWGESFIALNLVVKPVLDEFFWCIGRKSAESHQDHHLARIFESLFEDCEWQRQWSAALLKLAIGQKPSLRDFVRGVISVWKPLIFEALEPLESLMYSEGRKNQEAQLVEAYEKFLTLLDLVTPPN